MVVVGAIVVLIGLAVLVVEAHSPTGGVAGIGGVLAAAAGVGLVLAGSGVTLFVTVPVSVLLALAGLIATLMIVGEVAVARRRPLQAGPDTLAGTTATIRSWSGDSGQVAADGTLWSARLSFGWEDPAPRVGEVVVIDRLDGLNVTIRRPTPWEVTPRWKPSSPSS